MPTGTPLNARTGAGGAPRVLVVIPAFNEAGSLPAVVSELRSHLPDANVLVIDDGSTDGTRQVLADLDVRWLRMPMQMGLGAAVRAGLRYACRGGYDAVVRIDGDGQHPAGVINRLLEPVLRGDADVTIGSRYLSEIRNPRTLRRGTQYVLGRILSVLTRQQVTDPTSGLWVFGRKALQVLRDHHPSGYPEPELLLFLSRNRIRVTEVQVRMRDRLAGQTSLTPRRMGAALARLTLLLVVVPLRSAVGARDD
ncbi:glycosyltransferase family 2 protein [soil metagenome]